ncbi:MAG: M20/M25/M40 family metallo-hydrolase, partial [Syntrophothermus sp.]
IKEKFTSYGFSSVETDSFECTVQDHRNNGATATAWQRNVVATITGVKRPEEVIVIGGHYDSYSTTLPSYLAPGADDDASGTAATMELARILRKDNFQPDVTIKFVAFGAEELMLSGYSGSVYFSDMAKKNGMKIILMVNLDMIANSPLPVGNSPVDLYYYTGFEYLVQAAADLTGKYSRLKATKAKGPDIDADSKSFASNGFPAIFFMEHTFSPNYHTDQDIVENCNMEYCAEVAKAAGSMLIWQSFIPQSINSFKVTDAGTGSTLKLNWDIPSGKESLEYRIYLGTAPGVYSDTFTTTQNHYELTGLKEGTQYYAGMSAVSPGGLGSFVVEKSATPNSIPLVPSAVAQVILPHKLKLTWQPNKELDLLGYCIYRKDSTQASALRINDGICRDTFFIDETAEKEKLYFYSVKAVDSDSNYSQSSTEIKARVFSLDQGILLINLTYDGSGTSSNPSYKQVDDYYKTLFQGQTTRYFDIRTGGQVTLLDLGIYSTAVIISENPSKLPKPCDYLDELKKYMDLGGNLIFLGFKPSMYFQSNYNTNGDFVAGDFRFDYLKIKNSKITAEAGSNKAISLFSPYMDLRIDSAKAYQNDFHMPLIESISAADGASQVYKYASNYSSSLPGGNMNDLPVGVEYFGTNYKTFVLTYPLYYVKQEDAKDLINAVVQRINAPSGAGEHRETSGILSFALMQNYPNPFNPATTISYSLPKESFVELKVYDVLGREVITLIQSLQSRGEHKVQFNASSLPSGMYIYSIQAGELRSSKKLLLLK